VWHGHVRLIKDLVDAGADASLLYANDLSLLHLAIQADQLAMVDFLAKDKSTLEFKTSDCWTPLYSASWAGKLELVEHLLGAGANLESKNYADNIPLHIAAYKGHKEVVTYLLSLDDEQETHLVEEIAMDDTEDRPVCEEKSKDATATETGSASARNGETSFSEKPTTEGTGVEVIGTAMEVNNTTKDTSANGPGRTINPSKDKSPAVPKLVPKAQIIDGVEVPEKPSPLAKRMVATYNQDGEYPIHSAAIHGHTEVVKILLLHGADCNVQRDSGATPLHLASRGGHLETVQLLLDHKADPNIQNNSGRTPLHYASEKTNEAVAKALLDRGANPNLLDKHGRSPLHRACLIGAESMAKLLHAAGADPFLIDDAGRSVEDWSHINGVDLELESPPEQSAKKRRKRDATIKKLLDDADLSKIWGFDTVGRLLTYYGRDLDAQICFERAATFIFEDGPVDDPPSAKEEGKTSEEGTTSEEGKTSESESTAIATEEPSPTPNSENPKKETRKGKPMQGRPEACKSIIEKWEATATSETEPQTAKPDIATPAPSLPTDADLESELDKPENSDPAMSEPGPENATPDNPPPDPSLPPDSTAESQPDNPPTPPSVTPKISHRACCDGCPDRPRLLGIRFVCRSCDDRDLCEACMEKYPKADGGVDVPGCKGHAFLRLPQEGWEHFDYDVVTAEGLSAEEWLGGMREEWAWREILNAEGL
jgi:ankyrin repeat protein